MNIRIALYILLAIMMLASLCGIYRFKKIDYASKIIAIITCCAFVIECVARYLALNYHNNMALYTIYSLLEFGLLSFYFNNVIDIFRRKNIGIYIGVAGISLGILNIVFVQPLNTLNSYFLFLEGLLVIGMSLFAFFRLLLKENLLSLSHYPHFWFISLLAFFWCITFLNWGLYDYFSEKLKNDSWKINLFIFIVNIITYSGITCIFILYPKMQETNE